MKFQGKVKIIEKKILNDEVFQLKVERPQAMGKVTPGQFFNFKVETMLLRRPISVSSIGVDTLEFTIKIMGKGTKEIDTYAVGEEIDIMGPLGNGYELSEMKTILVIGGGIGVAPIKGLIDFIESEQVKITSIIGFRDEPYLVDEFNKKSNQLIVMSENDFNYRNGFVINPLIELIEESNQPFDMIYACGPQIMLKKVQEICNRNSRPVQLLMEEKMACGIGACLVCTCKTKSGDFGFKHSKMCVDGPMFYGSEVMFDE